MKVKHLQKKLETRIRAMPANWCSVTVTAVSISLGTSVLGKGVLLHKAQKWKSAGQPEKRQVKVKPKIYRECKIIIKKKSKQML